MLEFPIKLGFSTQDRTSLLKVIGFCLNSCGLPMLQKVILSKGYSNLYFKIHTSCSFFKLVLHLSGQSWNDPSNGVLGFENVRVNIGPEKTGFLAAEL